MKRWKESKRGTKKTKVGEGRRSNSEHLEKKEHLYYEEKQIQMHKKEHKKDEVKSNILFVIKAYICLYVYIFIKN